MTGVVWPDWPAKRRPRRWRVAPVWHAAVSANKLLIRERREHEATRHELTIARARQTVSAEELIDANARIRRLEHQLTFLVDCRMATYFDDGEGSGAWMDGERPA